MVCSTADGTTFVSSLEGLKWTYDKKEFQLSDETSITHALKTLKGIFKMDCPGLCVTLIEIYQAAAYILLEQAKLYRSAFRIENIIPTARGLRALFTKYHAAGGLKTPVHLLKTLDTAPDKLNSQRLLVIIAKARYTEENIDLTRVGVIDLLHHQWWFITRTAEEELLLNSIKKGLADFMVRVNLPPVTFKGEWIPYDLPKVNPSTENFIHMFGLARVLTWINMAKHQPIPSFLFEVSTEEMIHMGKNLAYFHD